MQPGNLLEHIGVRVSGNWRPPFGCLHSQDYKKKCTKARLFFETPTWRQGTKTLNTVNRLWGKQGWAASVKNN